ncbi:hypothetical protein H8K52_17580 [Undibacterium seohonense]|jgi:hypothetical protein|uniref:SGNH/GDSL hydrolase family protein n=1 Tax=Undibacterium seohonense TaxID=1344950 RepID=A0ABR6X9B4_9BURK|nr:hypothetical protein [Undibacterium seohonense]MBC3809155.1 hypothetical protein [Undibacterium seohonense]
MKLLKNLLLSIVSIAVVLGIAETALHFANFPATPKHGWKWDESPYRGPMNQHDQHTNQLGLRGQNIAYTDDDFVVVLVGDSQTEAGTQVFEDVPEGLLEKAIKAQSGRDKVKVFSVASAGWGQDQQLLWLTKYFEKYRANAVLVWTTPVNDYWENTFIDRSITLEAGKLKPTYTLDGDKLKAVIPASFEWKLRTLLGIALSGQDQGKKSSIEQVHLNQWLAKLPSTTRVATEPASCPKNEVIEQDVIEAYRKGERAYTIVTEEDVEGGRNHFSPFLKNLSPREQYSIDITHRLFQEIASVSQQHGASFNIVHTYRNDLDASFREIQCIKNLKTNTYFAYDGSDWLRHLKKTTLANQLIPLKIESEKALNVREGDWHFGKEGNELAMQELAKVITQKYLSKP